MLAILLISGLVVAGVALLVLKKKTLKFEEPKIATGDESAADFLESEVKPIVVVSQALLIGDEKPSAVQEAPAAKAEEPKAEETAAKTGKKTPKPTRKASEVSPNKTRKPTKVKGATKSKKR